MSKNDISDKWSGLLLDDKNIHQNRVLDLIGKNELNPEDYSNELILVSVFHPEKKIRESAEKFLKSFAEEKKLLPWLKILQDLSIPENQQKSSLDEHKDKEIHKLVRSEKIEKLLITWAGSIRFRPSLLKVAEAFIEQKAFLPFCQKILKQIIHQDPDAVFAQILMGRTCLSFQKSTEDAEMYYYRAEKTGPEKKEELIHLAKLAFELEKYAEAVLFYAKLQEKAPDEPKWYIEMATIHFEYLNDPMRAEQLLDICETLEPANEKLIKARAKLIWLGEEDPEAAAEYLEESIDSVDEDKRSELYTLLARISHIELGQLDKARHFYMIALQSTNCKYELVLEAAKLIRERFSDYGMVKSIFEFYLLHNPKKAQAHADFAHFLDSYTQEESLVKKHVLKAISLDDSFTHLMDILEK